MYISVNEAYAAAKEGRLTIYRLLSKGELKAEGVGSVDEYVRRHNDLPIRSVPTRDVTLYKVRKYVKEAKKSIINRDERFFRRWELRKWVRPWSAVPALRNWRPNAGDYGVGVEIEMGFTGNEAVRTILDKCKNWRWVTADYEGGRYPIEMTFPPCNYSKIDSKWKPLTYLKLLNKHKELVHEHDSDEEVGTHVNVSVGTPVHTSAQLYRRFYLVGELCCNSRFGVSDWFKYFGRRPYGSCYVQNGVYNGRDVTGNVYFEFKLFNSTLDLGQFKRYVHEAVELAKLCNSNEDITMRTVKAALKRGYNKVRD